MSGFRSTVVLALVGFGVGAVVAILQWSNAVLALSLIAIACFVGALIAAWPGLRRVRITLDREGGRPSKLGTLHLHEILDGDGVLRNQDLKDVQVIGPGILVFDTESPFLHCTFDGYDLPAIWILPEFSHMGAIAVERCTFTRCRFQRVGWAMPPEAAEGLVMATEMLSESLEDPESSGAGEKSRPPSR